MRDDQSVVAVVDDDPAVLNSLKFLIEVSGHRVSTYGSALAFLDDRISPFACLILDHHMPQMTGLELAEHLHTEGRGLPILLITGAASPAIVAKAGELGIKGVLDKPPTEGELLAFIRSYV